MILLKVDLKKSMSESARCKLDGVGCEMFVTLKMFDVSEHAHASGTLFSNIH